AITGLGLLTPVGVGASQCFHSVRCSVSRLKFQPYPDRAMEWVVGGSLPLWVPFIRDRRLPFLAGIGVKRAWLQAFGTADPRRLGPMAFFLGAPEPLRPGYGFPPPGFNFGAWLAGLGLTAPTPCEVIRAGPCSAPVALTKAQQVLDSGQVRSCVI